VSWWTSSRLSNAASQILAELKPGRELYTTVKFYAVSLVIGWSANILEQAGDPKIIRPAARYVGAPPQAS
jgi:citrate synthase